MRYSICRSKIGYTPSVSLYRTLYPCWHTPLCIFYQYLVFLFKYTLYIVYICICMQQYCITMQHCIHFQKYPLFSDSFVFCLHFCNFIQIQCNFIHCQPIPKQWRVLVRPAERTVYPTLNGTFSRVYLHQVKYFRRKFHRQSECVIVNQE